MRAHRKLMTPLGVLGVLAASAAIQAGAGAGVPVVAVNPLVGHIDRTIDTITDQIPNGPDEMHW